MVIPLRHCLSSGFQCLYGHNHTDVLICPQDLLPEKHKGCLGGWVCVLRKQGDVRGSSFRHGESELLFPLLNSETGPTFGCPLCDTRGTVPSTQRARHTHSSRLQNRARCKTRVWTPKERHRGQHARMPNGVQELLKQEDSSQKKKRVTKYGIRRKRHQGLRSGWKTN